jgi:hypothetical protein
MTAIFLSCGHLMRSGNTAVMESKQCSNIPQAKMVRVAVARPDLEEELSPILRFHGFPQSQANGELETDLGHLLPNPQLP